MTSAPDTLVSPRIDEIDIWRGLAIGLVVLGHAIQATVVDFDANWLFRAIYVFHMPLFFFISGLVGASALDRPLSVQLKNRTLGLVVPFLSWYLLVQTGTRILTGDPSFWQAARALYLGVDRGLWFLWVLFLVSMFSALLAGIPRAPRTATFLIACVAVQFIDPNVLGLGFFKWYFPYFAVGILLAPRVSSGGWKALRTWWVPVAALGVYAVLAFGWTRLGLVPLAAAWKAYGLPLAGAVDLAYRYTAAGAGIFASLALAVAIPIRSTIASALKYLGVRTLDVYVSHQLLLIPFASLGVLWVPVATVFAVCGALAVAWTLKRFNGLKVLLYGGRA